MIFRQAFLDGIANGRIDLAFRRWRRPSVKPGGTLLTAAGLLHIGAVEIVSVDEISDKQAKRAGYPSRGALIAELMEREEGAVYCIELGKLEADPRIALREQTASGDEIEALIEKLARLDKRSGSGPWTRRVLEIIRAHPAVNSSTLCVMAGQDRPSFKLNVRKLKALGLTESLEVGYRLSPRGAALLDKLR